MSTISIKDTIEKAEVVGVLKMISTINYIKDKVENLGSIGAISTIWLTYFSYKHFHLTYIELFIIFVVLILPITILFNLADDLEDINKFLMNLSSKNITNMAKLDIKSLQNFSYKNFLSIPFILKEIHEIVKQTYGYQNKFHMKVKKISIAFIWVIILTLTSIITIIINFI